MKIKDNKCKCGHDDFFFNDEGKLIGIYCSYCGRWLKWANKDELKLKAKQQVSVLDKIKAEVRALTDIVPDTVWNVDVLAIIDKYKAESEEYVKEQTQWIPVSERLPEKDMPCLVSVGEFNLTQIAMYSDLMKLIDHRIFYQGDVGYDSFRNITEYVKAWMPLPPNYQDESGNKE